MADLDAIERTAKAATSGEWRWDRETGTLDALQDERSHVVTVACAEDGRVDIDEADAEFVVACQPSMAIEMAGEIRRLRAALKEADDISIQRDRVRLRDVLKEALALAEQWVKVAQGDLVLAIRVGIVHPTLDVERAEAEHAAAYARIAELRKLVEE